MLHTVLLVAVLAAIAYALSSNVTLGNYPGGSNTYIPDFENSGRLITAYLRDPATFPLARYIQVVPCKQDTGYYLNLTPQEAARVGDIDDDIWNYGDESPEDNDMLAPYNFISFKTQRRRGGFSMPDEVVDQSDWDVLQSHADNEMNRLKTKQAIRANGALIAGLTGTQTATATVQGGGKFNAGTSTSPFIKVALNKTALAIQLATLGAVTYKDLRCIVNPNLAAAMGASPELHDYLKGSPDALREFNDSQNQNKNFGLGPTAYGMDLIIEDTVKLVGRKSPIPLVPTFVQADTDMFVVARKGALEGRYGSPSFTTLVKFAYEELSLEVFDNRENRRRKHKLTENIFETVVAPASGFRITACI